MIVGVGYKMRQGKDTIADYLVKNHGFIKMSFAEALKVEVSDPSRELIRYMEFAGIGVIDLYYDEDSRFSLESGNLYDKFYDYIIESYDNADCDIINAYIKHGSPKKDRELLQLWGTDYKRSINPNYWVDRVAEEVYKHDGSTNIVFSDMRFLNEYNFVKELTGITVNVFGRDASDGNGNHPSEVELDGSEFDWEVENTGTIPDLYGIIDKIVEIEKSR